MVNECLVTKLKGSVENTNLRKLGEWRFKAWNGYSFIIPKGCTVEVLSGGGTVVELPLESDTLNMFEIDVQNAETGTVLCDISISNKYGLYHIETYGGLVLSESAPDYADCTRITFEPSDANLYLGDANNIDTRTLRGYTRLTKLIVKGDNATHSHFDLSDIATCTGLTHLIVLGKGIMYGKISDLSALTNLSNVDNVDIPTPQAGSTLTGRFADFGLIPNIRGIGYFFNGAKNYIEGGAIEDFVANKRAIGETSGTFIAPYLDFRGDITLGGQHIISGSHAITWTATTIDYGSMHVDNSDVANL